MQLPGVADATEQPCPSSPVVSAPQELPNQATCHHSAHLPPGPCRPNPPVPDCLYPPAEAARAKKEQLEGERGRESRGGEGVNFFFFCTHPYKATEVITDVTNQLSKQAPLTNVPFYKHSLASPYCPSPSPLPSLPQGFALP